MAIDKTDCVNAQTTVNAAASAASQLCNNVEDSLSVYLAGPDVFHANADQRFSRLESLLAQHSLRGRRPLDNQPLPENLSKHKLAHYIAHENLALLRRLPAMLINCESYPGPFVDAGTCVELGAALALHKHIAFYNVRSHITIQELQQQHNFVPRDSKPEDFDLFENLMISASAPREAYHESAADAIAYLARCMKQQKQQQPQECDKVTNLAQLNANANANVAQLNAAVELSPKVNAAADAQIVPVSNAAEQIQDRVSQLATSYKTMQFKLSSPQPSLQVKIAYKDCYILRSNQQTSDSASSSASASGQQQRLTSDHTGLRMWEGSDLLCRLLSRQSQAFIRCCNTESHMPSIIELGCGVGAPSLLLGKLLQLHLDSNKSQQHQITHPVLCLTDCEASALELVRENIELNQLSHIACHASLRWSRDEAQQLLASLSPITCNPQSEPQRQQQGMQCIVGADVVYPDTASSTLADLFATVDVLLAPNDDDDNDALNCVATQVNVRHSFVCAYMNRCHETAKRLLDAAYDAGYDCEMIDPMLYSKSETQDDEIQFSVPAYILQFRPRRRQQKKRITVVDWRLRDEFQSMIRAPVRVEQVQENATEDEMLLHMTCQSTDREQDEQQDK